MDGTGVHKGLDPGAVCMVLVAQANGSDTPGLALAPSPPTPLTLIGPEDRRVGMDGVGLEFDWVVLDGTSIALDWV